MIDALAGAAVACSVIGFVLVVLALRGVREDLEALRLQSHTHLTTRPHRRGNGLTCWCGSDHRGTWDGVALL